MAEKLKIAIFHLAFVYSGGGEKLVLEEAKWLKKLGHRVEIFTTVVNHKKCFPDVIAGFNIKTFLPQSLFILTGHESFLVLLTCLLAPLIAIRFRSYDVILAANQPSPWMAYWVKKFFDVPYVSYLAQPTRFLYPRKIDKKTGLVFTKKASGSITTKMMEKGKRFIRWADKTSIRSSNKILANGHHVKYLIEKVYKIKAESCPAGAYIKVKLDRYGKREKGDLIVQKRKIKKPYFLITNRHFGQKRFEYGILTLSLIAKKFPKISLVITGEETEYTDQLKVLVDRLNLNGKVIFLGYANEKDLLRLYGNCTVYLYTAPEEDFGMGIIESMACGAPVVAWANGGPKFIIKDGESGFLSTPFEIDDFVKNVEMILRNKKLAQKIGREAYKTVKNYFSYKHHIFNLEKELKNATCEL